MLLCSPLPTDPPPDGRQDKERKTPFMLASMRQFSALADLLDPSNPLPGRLAETSKAPQSLCCPITMVRQPRSIILPLNFAFDVFGGTPPPTVG